jgi:tetratricopeptide (TPR) repeat protein
MKKIIPALLLFLSCSCFSQTKDSLLSALKNATNDTAKCNILKLLIESEDNDNIWPDYNEQLLKITEKHLNEKDPGLHRFFNKYYASSLSNLGLISDIRGNIPKALEYYEKAMKLMEKFGPENELASLFNNLAIIHESQGEDSISLDYQKKALAIRERIHDDDGTAGSYINIGIFFGKHGDAKRGIDYLKKALEVNERIGDKQNSIYALTYLGSMYYELKDKEKALNYFQKGLQLCRTTGDMKALTACYANYSSIFSSQGQYELGRAYLDTAYQLAKKYNYLENAFSSALKLSMLDSINGNFKGAYENYKQYVILRDSLLSDENRKASFKSHIKYEFDKKEAVLKEQQEKDRIIIWSVIGGLVLMAVFAVFIFRSLQQNKKANRIITAQKELVEEKNHIIEEKQKEIIDSIHYARRIQRALIPNDKMLDKELKRLKSKV